ncbi:MAG: SpoIIE family protein phosphatase [Bacteroidota bacterium]
MTKKNTEDWKRNIRNKLIHSRPHRIGFVAIPLILIFTLIKENSTEKQFTFIMILFLGAMVAFLMYNFRVTDKAHIIIKDQHKMLEEKQREILSSISYALRIQNAILPSQKIIKQNLEQYFILYKPKDIVAGDFYWMEKVDDKILFAACDCTGHGVPGAMVSVVCNNALNRAVREFELTQPAAILDKTAEIIIENFSTSEEEIQDGMDISICALNLHSKKLLWAGANNPLWLIRNGELIETKANKQSIGKSDHIQPFTNHEIQLESGDSIYIFSDGFADQFGGEAEKKLTRKRFKEQLLSVQHLPMKEQGIALENFISTYRKETEQTDDILVMGVKI